MLLLYMLLLQLLSRLFPLGNVLCADDKQRMRTSLRALSNPRHTCLEAV